MKIPKNICNCNIPYMGSKCDIAYSIMMCLYNRHPNALYFYDLFGGGGAMSLMAQQFGLKVFYNEINPMLPNLLLFLKDNKIPDAWWQFVNREKYNSCVGKTDPYSAIVQTCYSFGNNIKRHTYLFSKDIEHLKFLGHQICVWQDEQALAELSQTLKLKLKMPQSADKTIRRLFWLKQIKKFKPFCKGLQQLQQLEQLERLQRLQQLEELQQLEITCGDYRNVKITTPPEQTIIYLDPPYRGTAGYSEHEFNYTQLDEFFKNNKYVCYMSEYNAPFECVLSLNKLSLLNGTQEKRKYVKEKLFWNGKKYD